MSSLSSVVLPAPFGPTMPIRSPRWMRSVKSRMIARSPIALRHAVGLDHRLRANVVLGDGELRRTRRPDHRRALRPHVVQLGEASLVAAAAGGDPALQPAQLERQLGVELLGGSRLLLVGLFHPGLEPAEADLGAAQMAAVEPQAALRQPRQEGPVVADDDERAGEAVQPVLQPFDAGQVEMVGRLVEQQHVRLLRDRADDRGAAPLAAAGGRDRPRQVEPDLVGDGSRLVRLGRVRPVQHPVEQGRMVAHVRVLLEQHDAAPRDDRSPALVRVDQAGEALQQGRLARAVAADQRQPVARADVDVEMAEQPAFALNEPEVFVRECRRRHGPPDRCGYSRRHPLQFRA